RSSRRRIRARGRAAHRARDRRPARGRASPRRSRRRLRALPHRRGRRRGSPADRRSATDAYQLLGSTSGRRVAFFALPRGWMLGIQECAVGVVETTEQTDRAASGGDARRLVRALLVVQTVGGAKPARPLGTGETAIVAVVGGEAARPQAA